MAFDRKVNYFKGAVRKYGTAVTIYNGSAKTSAKAFVQPYTMDFQRKYGGDLSKTRLGETLGVDLVAYFAPDVVIGKGAIVVYRGRKYVVVSVDGRGFAGEPMYNYAVLRLEVKGDDRYYNDSF